MIKFKQFEWLKSCTSLTTEYRTNSKKEFEKEKYKLLNNSISGKTIQNNKKQ